MIGHFKKLVGGKPSQTWAKRLRSIHAVTFPKHSRIHSTECFIAPCSHFQSLHKTVRGLNVPELKLMYSLIHNNELMISRGWPSVHWAWSKTHQMPRCDEVHVARHGSPQVNSESQQLHSLRATVRIYAHPMTLIPQPLMCVVEIHKSDKNVQFCAQMMTFCYLRWYFCLLQWSHDKLIDNKSACFYNGTASNLLLSYVHCHSVHYLDTSTWTQFLF